MQEPSENSGSESGWGANAGSSGAESEEQSQDPGSGDGLMAPFAGPDTWEPQEQRESATDGPDESPGSESEAANGAALDGDLVWDSGNIYSSESETPSVQPTEPWKAASASMRNDEGDQTWLAGEQVQESESSSGTGPDSDFGTEQGSGVLDLSLEAETLYEPSTDDAETSEPPADAPWDALGQAVDDALLRASEGAALIDQDEAQEDSGASETDDAVLLADTRGEAATMAARLESLAARLRSDGVQALDRALRSDDREEAAVAAFLAGMRAADRD